MQGYDRNGLIFFITIFLILLMPVGLIFLCFFAEHQPIINKTNGILFFLFLSGLFLNVFSNRRMSRLISASNTKLSVLIDQMADMVIITDLDGEIVDVNQKACSTLGYGKAELIGLNIRDLKAESLSQSLSDDQIESLLKGNPVLFETCHKGKNKDLIPVEIHLSLLENDGKKQILRVVRNIKERKQAEDALKRSEQRLKEAHKIARLGHWEIDHLSNQLFWSDEIFRIFELDRETFTPSYDTFIEMVHPEDRSMVDFSYKNSIRKKDNYDITHRLLLPSGKIKYLQERCRHKFDTDGGILLSIGTVHDITYVKETELKKEQAERQLFQFQKLEAVGTLAAGIAHDFNNILSAIMGYTQLCLDAVTDSYAQEFLNQIMNAGERARGLVKQILTFSRSADQEILPVKVKPIIREALQMLRATLLPNIRINERILSDSVILGDPTKIHQVVMNLCANAIHAMKKKGGVLSIELEDVYFDEALTEKFLEMNEGNYLALTVSDTGHGMTSQVKDRIFEPFFTTKKENEGNGLGLSIVHGIVKTHGGNISVYSEPDHGTTFRAYFPVPEAAMVSHKKWYKKDLGGNERILVIDDEEYLCEILEKMLRGLGYIVTSSQSVHEAIRLMRENPLGFDLVITDLTMPEMRGDRVAKELLKIREDIPVIICTGFSDGITQDIAFSMGVKAFVMKPIIKNELAEIIRKIMDQRFNGASLK